MTNETLIYVVIAVVVLVLIALVIYFTCSKTKENFAGMGHSFTYKIQREYQGNDGNMYAVPSNYQPSTTPRLSNVDYGPDIRYNMPSKEMQAVPVDPISYGNMVQSKEGFAAPACSKAGLDVPKTRNQIGNSAGPNFRDQTVVDAEGQIPSSTTVTSLLPVGNMTDISAGGAPDQPVVYERFIYANQKSRLRAQGDPIRGDLPIVPNTGNWFTPSVQPQTDLHEGALNAIAGMYNETANNLHALQSDNVGGMLQVLGGVNMGASYATKLSGGQADIEVTAFP
ncbi:MAG: hypothetical protein JKX76_01500 [Colwellia sp.]|nr:hypothetical protein [Colwellia sp.]